MSTTEPVPYPQSSKELLEKWLKRLRESQFAHYEAAKTLSQSNYTLGIPAVILSTVVGTSIFASLGETPTSSMQIVVGKTSVLAATLSAVQTFLGLSERASKHRAVASRYGSTRRKIEQMLALSAEALRLKKLAPYVLRLMVSQKKHPMCQIKYGAASSRN